MNYTKIYASIVLRAQAERTERLALKKQGTYFEDHHIVPKSFGGSNAKSNLALLTAREHFICHWLLVKMYPIGSLERGKMLNALWRMQGTSQYHPYRYVNSRTYEYLRREFSYRQKCIVKQQGDNNSQYGKKWYTSRYTGESRLLSNSPSGTEWVLGRNLFNGRSTSIKQLIRHYKHEQKQRERRQRKVVRHSRMLDSYQCELHENAVQYTRQLWDQFHAGNYDKIEDFAKEVGVSKMMISIRFRKYIPIYKQHNQKKLKHCRSNQTLIGQYE